MRAIVANVAVICALSACHDLDAFQPTDNSNPSNPSCASLAVTCGPYANESCCAAADVPGGQYLEGEDQAGTGPLGANDPATANVSEFALDKYEVTVGRFRAFVNVYDAWINDPPQTGAGADPSFVLVTNDAGVEEGAWETMWNTSATVAQSKAALLAGIDGECNSANSEDGGVVIPGTWTDEPGADENKPMSCITWYEAYLFCIFDGGRLPTEAEWEFAAGGGSERRAYPWSSPNFGDLTITVDDADLDDPNGPVNVGVKAAGVAYWGHYDMAGNVFEWVMDAPANYDAYPGGDNPIDLGDMQGLQRVLRGGSFATDAPLVARTSARTPTSANARFRDIGVRCARAVAASN